MPRRALDSIAARIRENVRKKPAGQIDVAEERRVFDAMGHVPQMAEGTKSAISEIHGVRCDVIVPVEHDRHRSIVYFHGGAYALGSLEGYRAILSHIAVACRAEVWSVEYRLAPENPFPAAVDDAIHAWRSIQTVSALTSSHTIMMGDSAGGNLALATLVRARDEGIPLPTAAVLISPWLDLEHTGESMKTNAELDPIVRLEDSQAYAALYLGATPPRDPRVSPLYADLHGLPPTYVQVAKDEVLRDDATRFVDKAREAGVDVTLDVFEKVFHVWHFFAGIAPESDDAIARIGQFARRVAP